MDFKRIVVAEARELIMKTTNGRQTNKLQIFDIRDENSYAAGHIQGAKHLHNGNLQEFIDSGEFELTVLVYCYHGHMSMNAAAYLASQGFADTYSLDGGFEAWKKEV